MQGKQPYDAPRVHMRARKALSTGHSLGHGRDVLREDSIDAVRR